MAELIQIKTYKDKGFSTICLHVIENYPQLSCKAKHLHTYMMTRPPNWTVYMQDLVNRSSDGERSIYAGLKELEEAGLLIRERLRNKKGIFKGMIFHVYQTLYHNPHRQNSDVDVPHPHRRFPRVDSPRVENAGLNKNKGNTDKVHKKSQISYGAGSKRSRIVQIPLARFKRQPNGSLFGEKLVEKKVPPNLLLRDWLDFKLREKNRVEGPIFDMYTYLKDKKIAPDAESVLEVLEHWNEVATKYRHNGTKIPIHQIGNFKNVFLTQIIVTHLQHVKRLTVDELKHAIDNYAVILGSSATFTNRQYELFRFLTAPIESPGELLDNCLEGDVRDNRKYFPKRPKKKLTRRSIYEEMVIQYKRDNYGKTPPEVEKDSMWSDAKLKLDRLTQR